MRRYAFYALQVGVHDPSLGRCHGLHYDLAAGTLNSGSCLVSKVLEDLLSVLAVTAYIEMYMYSLVAVLVSDEVCHVCDSLKRLAVTADSRTAVRACN